MEKVLLVMPLLLSLSLAIYIPTTVVDESSPGEMSISRNIQPLAGDRTVVPGDTVTISCTKPTTPTDQVVWDKENDMNGGSIAIGGNVQKEPQKYSVSVSGNTQILTIKDVTASDDGTYRCYTLFNQDYDKTVVNVIVAPETVDITVTPELVNEGSYAALVCRVGPSKPAAQTRWFIVAEDGTESERFGFESTRQHANGTVTKSSELNIMMTRDLYSAKFRCNASLPQANYSDSANVTVEMSVRPGEPYLQGFTEDAIEGQMVRLSCVAPNGKPEAEITWNWDGSTTNGRISTTVNQNRTVNTVSTLEFIASPRHHNNLFICNVRNKIMIDNSEPPKTVNSTLTVKYTPQIQVDTTPRTAFEGNAVIMLCTARGNPPATRSTWLHNGEPIVQDERVVISQDPTSPTLTIIYVTNVDKGTYQCESTNEVGTSVSDIIPLTVLHAPVCKPRTTRKYGVSMSGTVEATCYIEAFPNNGIIFGWKTQDSWVVAPSFQDPTDADVVYSKLNYTVNSQSDYKNIECRADNGVGTMNDSCVYSILPPGPASPPNDCLILNVTATSIVIHCWEDFDGGSQPTYTLEGEVVIPNGLSLMAYIVLANSTSPNFDDVVLEQDTTYNLRVCASNKDFSQDYQCTNSFSVTTPKSNDTVTEVPENPLAASAPFIAVGIIAGVIVIIIIIAVIVICKKKQEEKAKNMEATGQGENVPPEMVQTSGEYTPAPDTIVVSSVEETKPGGSTPPPGYKETEKAQQSSSPGGESNPAAEDDMGDPVYDSADGMVGVMSAIALEDLRGAIREAAAEAISNQRISSLSDDIEDKGAQSKGFENAALVIETDIDDASKDVKRKSGSRGGSKCSSISSKSSSSSGSRRSSTTSAGSYTIKGGPSDEDRSGRVEKEPRRADSFGFEEPVLNLNMRIEPMVEPDPDGSAGAEVTIDKDTLRSMKMATVEDLSALSDSSEPPQKPERLSAGDDTKL